MKRSTYAGYSDRSYGTSLVHRVLAKASGPSRIWLFAIRNASRARLRVGMTLLVLSVSGAFFMSGLSFRQSMVGMLDRLFDSRCADVTVRLMSGESADNLIRDIAAVDGVKSVEAWGLVNADIPQLERTHRSSATIRVDDPRSTQEI